MTRSRRDFCCQELSEAEMQFAQLTWNKRTATMFGSGAARSGSAGDSERPRLAVDLPIHVDDDDDDDVQLLSPRSSAQVQRKSELRASRQQRTRPSVRRSNAVRRGAEIRSNPEADLLTLRLGVATPTMGPTLDVQASIQSASTGWPRTPAPLRRGYAHADALMERHEQERPGNLTIDLTRVSSPTSTNDDCTLITEFKKRKPTVKVLPEPAKELKLTCAICMDAMKEETSTICGHLFCRKCILGAIAVQKKCPTCRQKLTVNATHRIYISGSLRG